MSMHNQPKIKKWNMPQNAQPPKERIASYCVCCASTNLKRSPAVLMPFIAHRVFGWEPVTIDENWGLSTIQKGNAYSICSSLYCEDCGLLFLDIRFSEKELSNLYKDYRGAKYNALREHYEPGYLARAEQLNIPISYLGKIEEFLRPYLQLPATILDWGGDTGKNTPFQNQNNCLDIYDINQANLIADAQSTSLEQAKTKKYSLVVCSNVLEHVPYPQALLLEIMQTMDHQSVLYIEVPLEDIVLNHTADLHLFKKHWHEHINFFSEKSLRLLIQNAGLEILDLQHLAATAGGRSSFLLQVACKLKTF